MPTVFRAYIVNKTEEDFTSGFKQLTLDDLPSGDVLIKVAYSSVNYKDGLASIPEGKIVRTYPFVPGVDLAGIVAESNDIRFKTSDEVITTSYELGVSHFGGYSEYARVKADWVVPLPPGLTIKEAMALGTARRAKWRSVRGSGAGPRRSAAPLAPRAFAAWAARTSSAVETSSRARAG